MIKKFIQMIGVSMFIVVSTPALSDTIETVKSRGILNCGVNTGLPGFSGIDSNGIWQGLDVDFCRSVAAAVLGDSAKVRFVPLNVTQRFVALQSGEIDVLSRNTTWTLTRDTQLGLSATTINFHDGVGFMVRSKEKNLSIKDLNQSTICMLSGISSAQNVNDLFKSKNLKYTVIFFEDLKTAVSAYDSGRCNVYSNDKSQLASIRATMLKNSEDHSILNDIVVKSPLGPMVRQGDEKWQKLITWIHFAMLTAEELGVNSKNVDSTEKKSPEIDRLLGRNNQNFGKAFDLDSQWAYRVIKQVGNYEEVYERNVGKNSPLKMERGQNALWSKGGLQFAPAVQ